MTRPLELLPDLRGIIINRTGSSCCTRRRRYPSACHPSPWGIMRDFSFWVLRFCFFIMFVFSARDGSIFFAFFVRFAIIFSLFSLCQFSFISNAVFLAILAVSLRGRCLLPPIAFAMPLMGDSYFRRGESLFTVIVMCRTTEYRVWINLNARKRNVGSFLFF